MLNGSGIQTQIIPVYPIAQNLIIRSNIPQNNLLNLPNNSKKARVFFTKEEDEKIKALVKIFGTKKWVQIASFIEGRTSKQCRDRYLNYLFPGYFNGEWSKEDDGLLINLYEKYGPKWTIIQKSFQDRSTNAIKNRWYYFLSRQINENKQINNDTAKTKEKEDNTIPIPDILNNPKESDPQNNVK